MNKLSFTSRILIAVVSLSLIGTYFTPIWRIDLFAPQYPEGLTMKIWINDIKGQIDIINGLNHYIGMRKISVDMFPEFSFLIYVVGFYILLGLAVAIIGKRNVLFWYLIFTMFGGAFAIYDYYRWGYEYGHNLDPTAPIKVPGLSYQPPMLGHKRLLNFDAYSLPDIGGWIVIIAASLAFFVWFAEWKKHQKKNQKLSTALTTMLITATLVSCSSQPEPFKTGTDVCYLCKMGIVDGKFGSEVITQKGKVFKFDDIGCMVRYLKTGEQKVNEIARTVVINYEKQNDFIDTEKAFYVSGQQLRSPMGFNIASFKTKEAAEQFVKQYAGRVMTWNAVFKEIQ